MPVIRRNLEKEDIEIVFEGMPSKEIRAYLKSRFFRWYPPAQLWRKKYNDDDWNVMHEYFEQSTSDVTDESELGIGIEIEKEHTDDPEAAKKIALDHLKEDPYYYSKPKPKDWGKKEIEKEGKKAASPVGVKTIVIDPVKNDKSINDIIAETKIKNYVPSNDDMQYMYALLSAHKDKTLNDICEIIYNYKVENHGDAPIERENTTAQEFVFRLMKSFIENEWDGKVIPEKQRFDFSDVFATVHPPELILPPKGPTKTTKPVPATITELVRCFKDMVSHEDIRPAMKYIYRDDTGIVATDAYVLVHVPTDMGEPDTYYEPKTSQVFSTGSKINFTPFPKFKSIIPTDFEFTSNEVDLGKLLAILAPYENTYKIIKPNSNFAKSAFVTVKINDFERIYDSYKLFQVFDALYCQGTRFITLSYPENKILGVVIHDVSNEEMLGIVMPIASGDYSGFGSFFVDLTSEMTGIEKEAGATLKSPLLQSVIERDYTKGSYYENPYTPPIEGDNTKAFSFDDEKKEILLPDETEVAAALGKESFENGLMRTPAHDPKLMNLLKGRAVGESAPILSAWLKAWDKANLSAPIPDVLEENNKHYPKKDILGNDILTAEQWNKLSEEEQKKIDHTITGPVTNLQGKTFNVDKGLVPFLQRILNLGLNSGQSDSGMFADHPNYRHVKTGEMYHPSMGGTSAYITFWKPEATQIKATGRNVNTQEQIEIIREIATNLGLAVNDHNVFFQPSLNIHFPQANDGASHAQLTEEANALTSKNHPGLHESDFMKWLDIRGDVSEPIIIEKHGGMKHYTDEEIAGIWEKFVSNLEAQISKSEPELKENTPIKEVFKAAGEKYQGEASEIMLGRGQTRQRFLTFSDDSKPADRLKVYLVDGNLVRKDHIEFTMGGHGYIYDWIPKDEIWVDENLWEKKDDLNATIHHEILEVRKMRDEGMTYDEAHEFANEKEEEVRNKSKAAMEPEKTTKDDVLKTTRANLRKLKSFLSDFQYSHLSEMIKSEESDYFIGLVNGLAKTIDEMPGTYETEDIKTPDKIIYLHYFNNDSHWYIIEKDKGQSRKEEKEAGLEYGRQYQAYGYAILNGDLEMAEWGYVNIEELREFDAQLDFNWIPRKFSEAMKKWQEPEEEKSPEIKEEKSPETKVGIVIEWSEGLNKDNIPVKDLDELQRKLVTAGKTKHPKETYIKNKVLFDGVAVRIDNGEMAGDFDYTKEHIREYLKREEPEMDFSKYEDPQQTNSEKYVDFLDNLNELDLWQEFEWPVGTIRQYRKFILNPENERAVTDLGVKEQLTDITKGGKRYISAIISIKSGDGSLKDEIEAAYQENTGIKTSIEKEKIVLDKEIVKLINFLNTNATPREKAKIWNEGTVDDKGYAIIASRSRIVAGTGKTLWQIALSAGPITEVVDRGDETAIHWHGDSLVRAIEKEMKRSGLQLSEEAQKSPGQISLSASDYENEFDLNKAIEALLDRKWNDKPSDWSVDELQLISGYTGYGGLDKHGEITKKSLFEFFTPDQVIEKMWGLAHKYGYRDGPVCEPSLGIGLFFNRKYVSNLVEKTGYEINKHSAKIAKLLYPEANINDGEEVKYFEQVFISKNFTIRGKITPRYKLVIGNPPYGAVGGKYMGMGEKNYTHANNYIDYFILRGLDVLEKNGLLIYIIGAETAGGGVPFLDQGMNKIKEMIMERGKLIDAYRLPSGVFARTDVTSDIVVFRKK